MKTAISFIKNMIKNYIFCPETHIVTIADENSVKPLTSEKEYAIIQTLKGSKNVARRGYDGHVTVSSGRKISFPVP